MTDDVQMKVRISIGKEVRKEVKPVLAEQLGIRVTDKMFDEFLRDQEDEDWGLKFKCWCKRTGAVKEELEEVKKEIKEEVKKELHDELHDELKEEIEEEVEADMKKEFSETSEEVKTEE